MHSPSSSKQHLPLPLAGEGRGEGKQLKLAFALLALARRRLFDLQVDGQAAPARAARRSRSCSSTPRRRSAPPRSTSSPTAKAPSEGQAPPAEVVVATDPADPDPLREPRARDRSRAARARRHRGGRGARDVLRRALDEEHRHPGYPPPGRRDRHAGVDGQLRRSAGRCDVVTGATPAIFDVVSSATKFSDNAPPVSRRHRFPALRQRHLVRRSLTVRERLQVVRLLRHHATTISTSTTSRSPSPTHTTSTASATPTTPPRPGNRSSLVALGTSQDASRTRPGSSPAS